MNKKRLWITNQILRYSVNQQWLKIHKNDTPFKKLNFNNPFSSNKLFHVENIKRLMCSGPKKDVDCPKDEIKPKEEKKPKGSGSGSGKDKKPGRHCFHKETEKILNEQALEEYNAAFAYLTMALYFGRTGVALPGCQGFFMNMYEEELGHGNIFVNYVLMRGGHVTLTDIKVPKIQEYTIKKAFKTATKMEMHIKEKLCAVFDVAEKHKDLQVMDLVSTEFMEEQNRSICEMARLCTRAKIVDTPVGEHLFDQFIHKSFVKTQDDNLMNKRNLEMEKSKYDIYK